MDGIPPALPTDSEDIAWALETAEALWRRGERVDAVVWVRRAAQAAGEGEDSKRAVALAKYAAELGDWIGSHAIGGAGAEPRTDSERALEAVDDLLGDIEVSNGEGLDLGALSARDIEVVSAHEFEAGFAAPKVSRGPHATSDSEIMTVSIGSPDVEIVDDADIEDFPEEEPTPVARLARSPVPDAGVPSAAQAHAGILDPWAEAEEARRRASRPETARSARASFDEGEVVTSAKRNAAQAPRVGADEATGAIVPRPPKAPRIPAPPAPRAQAVAPPAAPPAPPPADDAAEETDTTTYRQINVRPPRAGRPQAPEPPPKAPLKVPPPRPRAPAVRSGSAEASPRGRPTLPPPSRPAEPVAAPPKKPPRLRRRTSPSRRRSISSRWSMRSMSPTSPGADSFHSNAPRRRSPQPRSARPLRRRRARPPRAPRRTTSRRCPDAAPYVAAPALVASRPALRSPAARFHRRIRAPHRTAPRLRRPARPARSPLPRLAPPERRRRRRGADALDGPSSISARSKR